jgi:hypothetical protein
LRTVDLAARNRSHSRRLPVPLQSRLHLPIGRQQVAQEECITVTASLSAQNVVDDSGSFRPGVQRLRTLAKSVREVTA